MAAFYEGGISYTELKQMPVDELFKVIDQANQICKDREAQMKKARHGK